MPVTAYEVILADTEAARRIHHQIRYHIYCLQAGYEDPDNHPDGQECDSWDSYSVHFLVRERATNEWVGAIRLILPYAPSLPIERRTRMTPRRDISKMRRAELSRLCLVGTGKSLPGLAGRKLAEDAVSYRSTMGQRRRTGDILLALLHGVMAFSRDHEIDYWYFMTTQVLSRVVTKLIPMDMVQVGAPCWHRGERLPYLVDVCQVAAGLGQNGASPLLDRWPAFRRASELGAGSHQPQQVGLRVQECVG